MTTTRQVAAGAVATAVALSLLAVGVGLLVGYGSALDPGPGAALIGGVVLPALLFAVYAVLKRDSRAPAGLLTFVLGFVVVLATFGGYFYAAANIDPQQRCPQANDVDGRFGDAVTTGGLQYVLTTVEQDLPGTVGTPPASEPLGEWFVVHGTVTNIDDAPRTARGSATSRLIVCGTIYKPDEALSTPPTELNPGLTAETVQVFDVPADFPFGDPVVIRIGVPVAEDPAYVRWDGWGSVA